MEDMARTDFAGRGTRSSPIIAAMAGACTPATVWSMNPTLLTQRGQSPFLAERDPTPGFHVYGVRPLSARKGL
ncbi:hypothetical protein C1926_01145 [Stenotrophomonas sp. ZAC14A_NAIMI4_1]|nr:hypothetical protein C1926_01145 [Stenotrophomonas sp. ZAC14A_NAIMI4_1]